VTKKIIDPEDLDLFRQSIGSVKIVKSDKVDLRQGNVPKPYPKARPYDLKEDFHNGSLEEASVSHEDSLSYTAPGIQHNVLAKLRRGFFGVQAEIDLHGLNSDAAKQQLVHFLRASTAAGNRCIHIIHGKGSRSSEPYPVLKNNLNLWLRQHKEVQAFCSASQREGGTGAVYVLLRLSKDHPEKYGGELNG